MGWAAPSRAASVEPLAALLREAVHALEVSAKPFALVGGLAVSVRTEPRFTRDIGLAVAVADDEAEALVRDLPSRFRVLGALEHEARHRLATVRLGVTGASGEAVVDLLFASPGIEAEVVAAASVVEVVPGLRVPVARTGHLMALKLLARDDRRPKDGVDLQALLGTATPEEVELAAQAIDLIVERGAHRERDLRHEWRDLLARPEQRGDL